MRKINLTALLSKIVFLFCALFFCGLSGNGQTPQYYKSSAATSGNTIPFNLASQKAQLLYVPGEFNTLPISGYITKIYFRNSAAASTGTYTDFKVSFLQNTDLAIPSTSYYTGFTPATNVSSFKVTGNAVEGGWFAIPLYNPYLYDNTKSLVVEIQYTAVTGGISTITTTSTTGTKRVSGTSLTNIVGTASTAQNDFGMDVESPAACITPVAGKAIFSPVTGCAGRPLLFLLNGNSFGSGISFQWESSTSATGPFTSVSGPLVSSLYNTTASLGTTYYRAAVTCSGTTAYSDTVTVIGRGPMVAGDYTINSTQPTAGNNFTSFADAVSAFSCGVAGPVTFDVVAGTGPYEEQVTIPAITGASATNTITFNGNDNILRFNSIAAARHVIELDGADFVTFRKFNIVTLNASYGWGVHLTNEANNNTIDNCIIDLSASTSATASATAGITASGSTTSVTTAGSASNNTFTNNTITGGYNGIVLYGTATSLNATNNIITGNKILDFYAAGIEISHNNGAVISYNDISRPGRGAVTTFEGITMVAGNINCSVNANRIHDTHNMATTQSGAAYGIYSTACDAPAGMENKVTNNLIYNFNSTTGTIYGIYNSSSDGVFYYHNTVVLDNASSTSGITRGFFQTTLAGRIQFKNNIIDIRRGGTGIKYAIYMATATTTYESDFNSLFISTPAGTNYTGFASATSFVTLDNWKGGSGQDANSVATNISFQNPASGDFTPILPLGIDNRGTPRGVMTDISNTSRSATTPDLGAYEFLISVCTSPPDPGTIISNVNPICTGQGFMLSRINGSSGIGQTYQWESSLDNSAWSPVAGATGLSLSASQTQSTWYRLVVTCGVSVPSPAIQVVTPTGLSGTYTIDKTMPTSPTNFQSFNNAYSALLCGITGAVIFNVAPNSGPYEEQLIMQQIPGASSINTVTFNGNGNILNFISVNANERAVIKLNGTDHVVFDSLTISTEGTTTTQYGWGIQLLNDADSNTIRRCTIISSTTSTATSNYAGIVIGGSATSATATGDPNCDYNTFERNTIIGGYYGMTMVANGSSAFNSWNKIAGNTIRDFYFYGIYVNGSFDALIDSNLISRPTRPVVSTFIGIHFTGVSASAMVSRNTITNPFGGAPTSTSAFTGINFSSVDALAGRENTVANNLIYNLTGKGSVTGINNTSSDLALYYHNTIHLDGATDVPASTTRGFYQTTEAFDIQFKNNMITFSRNSLGEKHAVYLNTPTTIFQSDRNNFYFYSNSGTASENIAFRVNNIGTLADWKAFGQDLNSTSNNPLYLDIASGNFEPSNASIDNIGVPVVPVIPDDIKGVIRSTTTPDIGAFEFSPPLCVTPPTAGIAVSSDNPACENSLVTLSLSGNSTGEGQTYQWQTSSALNGTYTSVSSVLTNPSFTITATETAFFRAAVTCSGNKVYSTPVEIVVTSAFPGGIYTIDQSEPASATNFVSFTAARDAMLCGILGPVVFNVAPGGAPYTEQVRFDTIPGTSATNTITFNGNGNTIRFSSSTSTERAVITLSQTDYVTFNDLIIDATGTGTYGWGVFLTRDADNNTFRNCSILLNTTATSVNFAGVVISSSATSATIAGAALCDNNLFEGNTITGGYYGMTMMGLEALPSNNNRFIRNKVLEFYTYGIYVGQTSNALIEGNEISRPARSTASSFNGVYSTGISSNLQIVGNKIFNAFGGNTTSTSASYGVYISGNDANASQPTKVYNNLIYNMNGEGTTHGLYNSSSNNVKYYHNTIALDNTANTSTTLAYGFYQTTAADGIELKNNIIYVTRGGSGAKYGFYYSTATTEFISDYNNVYVNGAGSGANNFGYNSGIRATRADWETFNSQDVHSTTLDPVFNGAAVGDYTPQQTGIDNQGTPVGVATDIDLLPRSNTAPDPGAYEFDVTECTSPPTAGVAIALPASGICLGQNLTLNLSGNSTGGRQRYIWQKSAVAGGPWTDISDSLYNPYFEYKLTSPETFFRSLVVCGGVSVASTPVQIVLNPLLAAGDYTIDPSSPQSASNYQSFTAAVDALKCGIAGHIRFLVVPGIYTEQIRIADIPGVSANSTVTFMSQNGDPSSVTLTHSSTSATSNYVLQLDNSSYFTFKNITITAASATNSRVVDFVGNSSNDSILNNIINLPASTSTATASAGIFGTALTGNNLVIKGNTINNGANGIYLAGVTTVPVPNNYVIDSNTVKGTYYYSIYAANTQNIHINRNIISKSGLMNTTTYGIYTTGCDSAYQFNENKIDISNSGTTVYGIYATGAQASPLNGAGSVLNNKIIAGDLNTGNQYGMYFTSSAHASVRNNVISINTTGATSYGIFGGSTGGFYFHNNTVLSRATSTTNNVVAHFAQTSNANGAANVRNNVFSHTGGGIAMHVGNPNYIYSDYNMLYTTGPTLVRYGTTAIYPTLDAWKNASYWDVNSIVYAPALVSASDLSPDLSSPNVWAMHGRGVQIEGNSVDINGVARPTTLAAGVPDLGAYEFVPTSVPVLLTAFPASPVANSTQIFMLGTDTVTKITWGATVPATIEGRRYSGSVPPGLSVGEDYMYFYTDFNITGTAPSGFSVQQIYLDPWLGLIDDERLIKLGRTNNTNVWNMSATSSVVPFNNVISESNLTFLDKFTGLTNGNPGPVPPVTVLPGEASNMGTNFWVGYGHHQYFQTNNSQDMLLYLGAGNTAANVTVRVNGTSWVRTYSVPANSVISSDPMPKLGLLDSRLLQEGLSEKGISIESDVPITATAHIYASQNSGATMLLPVGTYGYEYYALTSKQNYASNTYSWFYVVAAYDSTLVEITPSNPTVGGRVAGVPFTVNLKKGEVYQVLGAHISGENGHDLTGSKIKSIANNTGKCYPVAVFSGSSRTNITCVDPVPTSVNNGDNIIQQNFPYKAWGRRYLTAPTSVEGTPSQLNTNIFKVMVKDPATVVRRNGVVLTNLINNLYYQFESSSGDYIQANMPVTIAQFMPSNSASNATGCTYAGEGDPEMIYLSPIEQGIKRVALYRNRVSAITTQYLTLIIPSAGVNSLLIDNSNVFDHVYDHPYLAGYKVVIKRWSPATAAQTTVSSDSSFTAITYGMGSAESYGYNAGTLVLDLNTIPGIRNVFSPSATRQSEFTCAGTPFKLSFLSSVVPDFIEWQISGITNMTPNANVTQTNPTAAGTQEINGVTYYRYELPANYEIAAAGTYTAKVAITSPDLEGCGRLETPLTITVVGSPIIDYATVGNCIGGQVQFNGSAITQNNDAVNSWAWDLGSAGSASNIQNPTYTYPTTGTYTVKMSIITQAGCIADTTKSVTVGAGPAVSFQNDSLAVCPGDNATLTVQTPVQNAIYNWYDSPVGGNLLFTGTTRTITNITTPSTFWVGSVLNGCTSASREEAKIVIFPVLTITSPVVDSASPNMIRFRWNAVTLATGYEVSINGGSTWITPSSGATGLTHVEDGLTVGRTITLQVRALGGCVPVISQAVSGTTVTDQIFIPNVFSPNNNGPLENERLKVYSNIIRELRFIIFNQWGQKIFETRDQSVGWDGTYNGRQQPSGAYIYAADIILTDGRRIQRKGVITLIR